MSDECRALMDAVGTGDLKEVKRLVNEEHADPNCYHEGMTALMCAAAHGHAGIAQFLIQRGATLDAQDQKDQRTALMMAAGGGHSKVVKLLLSKGARLDITDITGYRTALYFAAKAQNLEIVKGLLKAARRSHLSPEQIGLDDAKIEVRMRNAIFRGMLNELEIFERKAAAPRDRRAI